MWETIGLISSSIRNHVLMTNDPFNTRSTLFEVPAKLEF